MEQIVAEKKRRQAEERLRYFEPLEGPVYNDQRAFLYSTADIRIARGGNRSGKSEVGVVDDFWFLQGIHPVRSKWWQPPVHGRIVTPTFEGFEVIKKKIQQMVPRAWLKGGSWESAYKGGDVQKIFMDNGSTLKLKSAKQSLETHGADDLDFVHFDEHSPERYFLENLARLTDRRGYLIMTETPEMGYTFEEDLADSPPPGMTVEEFVFDVRKNKYLDAEGIARFVATMERDPVLFAIKVLGEYAALGGKVIPQFDPLVSIIPDRDIHKDAIRGFCIDTHMAKPCASMWAALEPSGDLLIYRTIKAFLTIPEWQNLIRVQTGSENVIFWMGDQSDKDEEGRPNPNNTESLLTQFKLGKSALPIEQVSKLPGSYKAEVFRLRNLFSVDPMFHKPKIYIFESCNYGVRYGSFIDHSLPWELKHLQFKKNAREDEGDFRDSVRRVNDHYFDDLRKLAAAMLGADTEKKPEPEAPDRSRFYSS
jgi:phage terminase large subunit-like protein